MTDLEQKLEALAIRAALGNNGGTWAEHYTEAQKEHWRQFVRDLIRDAVPLTPALIRKELTELMNEGIAKQIETMRVEQGGPGEIIVVLPRQLDRLDIPADQARPPWE